MNRNLIESTRIGGLIATAALLAALPACVETPRRAEAQQVPAPTTYAGGSDTSSTASATAGNNESSTTPPIVTASSPRRARRFFGNRARRDPIPNVGPSIDGQVFQTGGHEPQLSPERVASTHLDLAFAFEAQNRYEDAVQEYGKAVKAFESIRRLRGGVAERSSLQRRIGRAYDNLGRAEDAVAHFAEAKRLTPKDPAVWNDSGYSAYLQGRWTEAADDLRRAVALDPANPRFLTNLGLALAAAGEPRALEYLTKAGGPAAGHANLAFIEAASGHLDKAADHYRASLAAQPDLEPARLALQQLEPKIAESRAKDLGSARRE